MKKGLIISLGIIGGIVGTIIVILGGYVLYISLQYYRIEDLKSYQADIVQNTDASVTMGHTYTITTYNIGFGAYNHNFSFFMDSGVMKDGTKVSGKDSRAASKQVVMDNTKGVIDRIMSINPDFALFQEVDVDSTRSYHMNQYQELQKFFSNMSNIYVPNFHSAYLFYPLFNPHGKVQSGICTFSKYQIDTCIRHSLEISKAFPTKFFDLDRCFTASYIPILNGKSLVIVNVHLSAYDEGGVYRQKQWKQLNAFLQREYQKGNYIVCGGDFNHDIANTVDKFDSNQFKPDWVYQLEESDLSNHFTFATDDTIGTCRSTDIPYEKGVNYTIVLDGFIVSDNIVVNRVKNIDTNFMYSDHNPVVMEFTIVE